MWGSRCSFLTEQRKHILHSFIIFYHYFCMTIVASCSFKGLANTLDASECGFFHHPT